MRFLSQPPRVISSVILICALALAGAQANASPEKAVDRLVLRLPSGVEPAPLVHFDSLRDPVMAKRGAVGVRVRGAAAIETALRDAGVRAFGRLSDGLREWPPGWEATYVAVLDPPLSREEAEAVISRINAAAGERVAQVDARYELLVEPGFDWGDPSSAGSSTGILAAAPRESSNGDRDGIFPDDPLFADGSQWGLYNTGAGPYGGTAGVDVRAPEAWAITSGNTNVLIGLVDTGVDPDHPDLAATLPDGRQRLLAEKAFPGGTPYDSIGHGTMVCGVLGAISNNGPLLDGRGVAGMMGGSGGDSLGAGLVSVKATRGRSGEGLGSDIARGITRAWELGARAVNVSFGGPEPSDPIRGALAWAEERGTIVICGAGNSANSVLQYPGSYARFGVTVSVGAIAEDGVLGGFSTRGEQLDVVAPGSNIMSTYLTYQNAYGVPWRNYLATGGTSFAAPFVTGMAGLAVTLEPELVANDFQEILRRTARDWGPAGRDTLYGNGLVDAAALLEGLIPPRGVLHRTTAAQEWAHVGEESLEVVQSGRTSGGYSIDGDYLAGVWEVRTRVAPVPELLEVPEVWVRFTGNGGWSRGRTHEFDYSHGKVVAGSVNETGFELVTYVYFIDQPPARCPGCPPVGWVPRAPDEVEFEWTAWARLDAAPTVQVLQPEEGALWMAGSLQQVEWLAEDPDRVDRVEIRLMTDFAAESQLLGQSQQSSGSLDVVVPCVSGEEEAVLSVVAFDESGAQYDLASTEVTVLHEGEICSNLPFRLMPPSPNPARGNIDFAYWIPARAAAGSGAAIRLVLHDVRGRRIATLVDVADHEAGAGHVTWNGRGDDGATVRPGVYWATLSRGSERSVERFVYLP
jgi:subtilisin family serine protease